MLLTPEGRYRQDAWAPPHFHGSLAVSSAQPPALLSSCTVSGLTRESPLVFQAQRPQLGPGLPSSPCWHARGSATPPRHLRLLTLPPAPLTPHQKEHMGSEAEPASLQSTNASIKHKRTNNHT